MWTNIFVLKSQVLCQCIHKIRHGTQYNESGAVFQMPEFGIQTDLLQFGCHIPEVRCEGS